MNVRSLDELSSASNSRAPLMYVNETLINLNLMPSDCGLVEVASFPAVVQVPC